MVRALAVIAAAASVMVATTSAVEIDSALLEKVLKYEADKAEVLQELHDIQEAINKINSQAMALSTSSNTAVSSSSTAGSDAGSGNDFEIQTPRPPTADSAKDESGSVSAASRANASEPVPSKQAMPATVVPTQTPKSAAMPLVPAVAAIVAAVASTLL
ncbi:hypothetical protein P43SY_004236 [Pythium insidiosum]|uniref:Uncharacterized protein n=1 Tax=Pythium insidiosum TaxID=114742 RepID=A0AAD5LDI7_PYTIN|nr:hypothetical protein P43SY_004236 [Pythium insidiosum]